MSQTEKSNITKEMIEKWKLEIIRGDIKRGAFKSALFDFDGTLSLIRQGWQEIMIPYFIEVVMSAPGARDEKEEDIRTCVTDFVDKLTGKQTVYQCMQLDEEVRKRGGPTVNPLIYKKEYHDRLLRQIDHRLKGLRDGSIDPLDMVVPGTYELLGLLKERGIALYVASGTDEEYVLDEAGLTGVTGYVTGGIFGAKDKLSDFSKEMVIRNIIRDQKLSGDEFIGFGDGFVEIENTKSAHGMAVGVATDETGKVLIDEWKRNRLINAGADIIIPNYADIAKLDSYLFRGE